MSRSPRFPEAPALRQSEFARPVQVARLSDTPSNFTVEATEQERAALSQRLGLVAIRALEASVSLRHRRGSRYELEATLEAVVVQNCVVTLEPFEAVVSDRFSVLYGPPTDPVHVLEDDVDDIEPILDGTIDIGEAVAQQLSLVIDPYPRGPLAPSADLGP